MTSIDGDSSDEDSGNFAATNVLLGYASKEPTDDSFSQLGGQPVSAPDRPNLSEIPAVLTSIRHGRILQILPQRSLQNAKCAIA